MTEQQFWHTAKRTRAKFGAWGLEQGLIEKDLRSFEPYLLVTLSFACDVFEFFKISAGAVFYMVVGIYIWKG